MIEMRGVYKRFGEHVVLEGVNFTVQRGETVSLMGPSGTGKSVLLKHINGLIHPDFGEVFVDQQPVPLLGRKELARLRTRIGYVFQFGALFDSESVFENIKLGITNDDKARDAAYCRARVAQCLDLVNLPPDVADKYPADLSGGMKKRVGIARAIAGEPTYLLYAEPTSGLRCGEHDRSHVVAHYDALRHGRFLDSWLHRVISDVGPVATTSGASPS